MKKKNRKGNVIACSNASGQTDNTIQTSYGKAFLRRDTVQKRGNKSIYLSPEHHERLTRIVQIIGDDKIPLFAYLNNILEHHFNIFEGEITKEFQEKYKGLF